MSVRKKTWKLLWMEASELVKIKSGATAQDGRYVEVELDESDLPTLNKELSALQKHKAMMQSADIMIVKYMLDAGIFTQEFATQRLQEIKSR